MGVAGDHLENDFSQGSAGYSLVASHCSTVVLLYVVIVAKVGVTVNHFVKTISVDNGAAVTVQCE